MNPTIKPDKLEVSEGVLLDAAQAVRHKNKEHGHTERSFMLIGEMWTSYIAHAFTIRGETKLHPHDIANMMALVKMARAVYGYSMDNYVDGAGYIALSAMLSPHTVPGDKMRELAEIAKMFPKPPIVERGNSGREHG